VSSRHQESGEFYMPPFFLEFLATLATVQPGERVLDLCWRNDDLLDAIARHQPSGVELWGVNSLGEMVTSRHAICVSELLSEVPELPRESFDLVLVNPSCVLGHQVPEAGGARSQIAHGRPDSVALYLEWSTWYLKSGARLVATVPGGFLSSHSSKGIRAFLLDKLHMQAVFEFVPQAEVFGGLSTSTAVLCFGKASRDDYKPESFMAEIAHLDDWRQVYSLYKVALQTIESRACFQISLCQVGQSSVFTCKATDTFSPARNYFARQVLGKLEQFRTERLGDLAIIRAGAMVEKRSSIPSQNVTTPKLLTARHIDKDGKITGCDFLRDKAIVDGIQDTWRLCTNDILIRAIQPATRRADQPFRSGLYDDGLVVSIVPPEYEGALYDHTLLCIRLKSESPVGVTCQYLAQLFRNEFVLPGFSDLVLEQVVSATSGEYSFIRVVPSLLQDIRIPILSDQVLDMPDGSLGFRGVTVQFAAFCRHILGKITAEWPDMASNRCSPRKVPKTLPDVSPSGLTMAHVAEVAQRLEHAKFCQEFRALLENVRAAKTNDEKKKSLEDLAAKLLAPIEGLKVIRRDTRSSAEEVDLFVRNDSELSFWRKVDTPFLVECKNWSKPIGAPEIRDLKGKMVNMGITSAFLICIKGITGSGHRDGLLEVRDARKDGKFIVPVVGADLELVASGCHPQELLGDRFYDIYKI